MGTAEVCRAQLAPTQVGADSISSTIIPVIGYSSDKGLLGGGVYSRHDYSGNITPFKNYTVFKGLASTRGYINMDGRYEKTRTFGRSLRSAIELYFYQFAQDNFFGVGNQTTFDEQKWENEFYFFKSLSFGMDYRLRKPVYKQGRSHFDFVTGLESDYQIAYVRQENSSFNISTPNGSEGGWINYISGGFIWENRNSEFDPRLGNRAELEIRYAPDIVSQFALTTLRLDLRQYIHLLNFVTVAARVEGRHAGGDVPYWELSTLGDDYSLRGYPLNRFKGNSSLAYNLELRSWLIEFPGYDIKIGGHLFTDGGRVYTGQDKLDDLFSNFKHTVGFGGAISLFNPDFIMRGEIGFSEEIARLYIGVGYLF